MSSLSAPRPSDPRPTCQKVECPCVRHGEPSVRPTTFVWQENPDEPFPRLYVFADWSVRKGDWKTKSEFRVEETPTWGRARAFMLHRSRMAIVNDGMREANPDTYYGVLIANDQDCQCTCRGFAAQGRCKHLDGVRWAMSAGHLDHPLADPRHDPRPSEDQIAADADRDMCAWCNELKLAREVDNGLCRNCADEVRMEDEAAHAAEEHDREHVQKTPEQLAAEAGYDPLNMPF
jgi:hypothetical protein